VKVEEVRVGWVVGAWEMGEVWEMVEEDAVMEVGGEGLVGC
jgi:hypothetical protein